MSNPNTEITNTSDEALAVKAVTVDDLTAPERDICQKIVAQHGKTVASIIQTGDMLKEAKNLAGHGHWLPMCRLMGMHDRTASRLIAIAENGALSMPEARQQLPASIRTMEPLSHIATGKLKAEMKKKATRVHPDMTLAEAKEIRADLDPKEKARVEKAEAKKAEKKAKKEDVSEQGDDAPRPGLEAIFDVVCEELTDEQIAAIDKIQDKGEQWNIAREIVAVLVGAITEGE